ncbi:hypothetical protein StrepF001_11855 [Streptomyces sp. F001]|uniref:hypothetical protein n=1 Tax=Streptomyces sp. F001 TaxID=1510026 RepID=UPI00101E7554|nr:hypothetical protein [Streptomyces sp. F001]RZB19480.1 hypothetical protein StrepF001_11855 [Streptomyces sp. F001]
MLDLGRGDEACASIQRGRELISATGSQVYKNMSLLVEAKLWLRLEGDTQRADGVLAEAAANGSSAYTLTRETWQMWSGLSMLLQNRDAEAHDYLAECLRSMQKGDRHLDLPTAAVYLAEAQWRLGLEDESDATADLAMVSASAHGTQHLLLTALADVPSVAARAADTKSSRMSPWHEILAVLSGQHPVRVHVSTPRLVLEEFGEPALMVDGNLTQPRLTKSVELLSYLLWAPDRRATREELLGALFGGRNDAAAAAICGRRSTGFARYCPTAWTRRRTVTSSNWSPRVGHGFGATGGRPRRPGWETGRRDPSPDAVARPQQR